MTPDQLIELLEKAGMLKEESPGVLGWHPTMQKVERFAALLRAEEREACAQVCLDYGDDSRTAATCAAAIKARGKV
jgi:hypothetical protein